MGKDGHHCFGTGSGPTAASGFQANRNGFSDAGYHISDSRNSIIELPEGFLKAISASTIGRDVKRVGAKLRRKRKSIRQKKGERFAVK